MGCWNGTCFLSNMSIRHGDKVKLQLLMPSGGMLTDYIDLDQYDENQDPRDINGITHVGDNYVPFAPIITGEYSDYGSIEKVLKDGNLSFLKNYINDLVKNKKIASLLSVDKWLGRMRKEDETPKKGFEATIPVNVDDIEQFFDMVERGSIVVKVNRAWARLRFVMMHEDIYSEALKSTSKWTDWHDKNIVESQKAKQKQIIDFYTKGILPLDEDDKPIEPPKDPATEFWSRRLALDSLWSEFNYTENRIWFKPYLLEFCENTKDAETIADVVSVTFDTLNMNNYLNILRKPWALTGGCGSQHDNQDSVATHNEVISKFISKYNKALKARYGE